jgi:hypothetical protein
MSDRACAGWKPTFAAGSATGGPARDHDLAAAAGGDGRSCASGGSHILRLDRRRPRRGRTDRLSPPRPFRGRPGRVTIEDLGSTNGTAVNGVRIDGPVLIDGRAQIRIGALLMTLEPVAMRPSTPRRPDETLSSGESVLLGPPPSLSPVGRRRGQLRSRRGGGPARREAERFTSSSRA